MNYYYDENKDLYAIPIEKTKDDLEYQRILRKISLIEWEKGNTVFYTNYNKNYKYCIIKFKNQNITDTRKVK